MRDTCLYFGKGGLYSLHADLTLLAVARDKFYEFAFCFSPFPIKGAADSSGAAVGK